MRGKISSGMTLKESGLLLCNDCNREGDPGDKPLNVGDTYSDEPCDCCRRLLTPPALTPIIPPPSAWKTDSTPLQK